MSTYAELVYRARAGDPEAMEILGWSLPPEQEQYQPDPYLQQSMFNMFVPANQEDKYGEPKWATNLNLFQDYISEQADPVTAGYVGSAGLDPAALEPTPTWEPMETPNRQALEMYVNGSDWQGFVARALLDEQMTPGEALMAAQKAAEAGEFTLPMQQQQQNGPYASTNPPMPDLELMNKFATEKFEGLATEPDPTLGAEQGLTRWNEASQRWEARGEDEPSALAEKYKSLGLPMPTDQYDMDWMRQNAPAITDPADQMAGGVQAKQAELAAMARAAMEESGQNRRNQELNNADLVMRAAGRTPKAPAPFVDQPSAPYAPATFDYREASNPTETSFAPTLSASPPPGLKPGHGNEEMQQQPFLLREWQQEEEGRRNRPGLIEEMLGRGQSNPGARRTDQNTRQKQYKTASRQRKNVEAQRFQSNEEYDKNAIALYLLQQQGRTPYRDAMQARTQPMQQAGVMPPWAG